MAYFDKKGISDKAITVFPISAITLYARDERGVETGKIMAYRLGQSLQIQSADVELVTRISRESSELIGE